MSRSTPSFLLDCAAAIAAAPFDELLDVAERCGIAVRDTRGAYVASGYGIRAQRSDGRQQAVRAWGLKVEAAFGGTAGDAA